jgi:hypothetical protein
MHPIKANKCDNNAITQSCGLPNSRGYTAEVLAFTIGSGFLFIGISN